MIKTRYKDDHEVLFKDHHHRHHNRITLLPPAHQAHKSFLKPSQLPEYTFRRI